MGFCTENVKHPGGWSQNQRSQVFVIAIAKLIALKKGHQVSSGWMLVSASVCVWLHVDSLSCEDCIFTT